MIVFVDVDDVVADLATVWLSRYNHDYNDKLTPADLFDWDMTKSVKPECGTKIYRYIENPDIYNEVVPHEGAFDLVDGLRSLGHRVVFATSSTNGAAGSKYRWLTRYKLLDSYKNYVEVADKSLLRGSILIDDGPHNVKGFIGMSILYRRPHNRNFDWYYSAGNWLEAVELVRGITIR